MPEQRCSTYLCDVAHIYATDPVLAQGLARPRYVSLGPFIAGPPSPTSWGHSLEHHSVEHGSVHIIHCGTF